MEDLSRIMSRFSRKFAVVYNIESFETGVILEIEVSSGKALEELNRRLKISQAKSGHGHIKIEPLMTRGGTGGK